MKANSQKPSTKRPSLSIQQLPHPIPIESRITILRHQKIILDTALAEIYRVPVKRLNQQVNRNRERFPADFMFQLKPREFANLKLQFATSRQTHGGRRSLPNAFTEHGAIMVSTVLNSKEAVDMSVFVVRAFVRLRETMAANKVFSGKLQQLQKHLAIHDGNIREIIEVVQKLMNPATRRSAKIGFALPAARTG